MLIDNKDIHTLSYIKIPDNLWNEFLTYQYHRFHIKQLLVLLAMFFYYIFFSFLIKFSFEELFLADFISRLILIAFFFLLYVLFYYNKKNSETLDILITLFCAAAAVQWVLLFYGRYENETTYQLTLGAAPLIFICAYIKSRFRYTIITILICLTCLAFVLFQATHKPLEFIIIDFLYIVLPIVTFSLFICWDYIQRSRSNFLKQYRFTQEKNSLAEYNQDLIQQVYTDGLTQLGNKRLFEMEAKTIFHDAKELQIFNIAVLIIDIDYFKKYNDNYGHLQGDVCLKKISAKLQSITNLYSANVYRFGGEEFVISQRYDNKYEVINLARALIASITEINIVHDFREDKKNYLTISIGGCVFDESSFDTLHEMLDIADQKLYQAKSEGKETFVI